MSLQAVILAAGQGRRLLPLTREIPKALLSVDGASGITILECQISFLREMNIEEILVVVGYEREKVMDLVGDSVAYVINERYETTNSIYSFYLTIPFLRKDVLILNGDVLFHPHVLKRLFESPREAVISVDTGAYLDEESMKVSIEEKRVVDISKDLPPFKAHAENLGVVRFRERGLKTLKDVVGQMVSQGEVNHWIPAAFGKMLAMFPIHCVDVKGIPWIEIDFPHDLARAREEIFPQLWR